MNPSIPSSLLGDARSRIARLRGTFIEQLPARLSRAREWLAALAHAVDADAGAGLCSSQAIEATSELFRLLHGLKGSGRSFGLGELGECAARAEDLVARIQAGQTGQTAQADAHAALEALEPALARIEQALIVLEGQDGEAAGAALPVFDVATAPELLGEEKLRRIYVCDDEVAELEQLCAQIGCFGYQVRGFTDTESLRRAVAELRPDAIVMDICFPEGRCAGTKAIGELRREMRFDMPTLFLSARDDFRARLAAVRAGGDAYFCKPASILELVAAIDRLTRRQEPDPYRILIVDDEPLVAEYHALVLREAGMQTLLIAEPDQLLDALREFQPDMVLMDMYMPSCSGLELARLIRQLPSHVGLPIVYLSSETDREKQFSALRVGAEDFLTKPVQPHELASAVSIRAERMRILRGLMARDGLSGLYNHTTTAQLLDHAVASMRRAQQSLCFVMIDIDRFKQVNDTHGHAVGDQVIVALSRLLQQRLRASDVVGRYGGEEFAVVLKEVEVAQALKLIESLREDFGRITFRSSLGEFHCSFSAGLATYPACPDSESLRVAADKALYRAKRGGRNRTVVDCPTDSM